MADSDTKTREDFEREYNGVQVGVVEGKVFVMHRSGKGVLYDAADEFDSNGKVIGRRVSIVTLEGE